MIHPTHNATHRDLDRLPPATFWHNQRVIVTGGAGFLGSFVVKKLQQRGVREVIVPRRREYDLRTVEDIRRLLKETGVRRP